MPVFSPDERFTTSISPEAICGVMPRLYQFASRSTSSSRPEAARYRYNSSSRAFPRQ